MKACLKCSNPYVGAEWLCPECGSRPKFQAGIPLFKPELAHQGDGFAADYFEGLAKSEEEHFWFRSRNALILWALGRYLPNAKSFLEIGCGTGYVLTGIHRARPDLKLAGSEIFAKGLEFASQRVPDVELLQMDAREIPFQSEFDVVGAFDVLEHIEEDEAVLLQMYNAVKPGGGILITVPQHQWLWSQIDDLSFHKRRYSRGELVKKVEASGFRVKKVTSFVSALLPLMLLSRLRARGSQNVDLGAEFKISATLNAALLQVMNGEIALIKAGVPLYAGGSLLLVAQKD